MVNLVDSTGQPIKVKARYELNYHRSYTDIRDGNSTVADVGPKLWRYARHLDQNHDIIKGALDRLTQFVVGPSGIGIEPQPRSKKGVVNTAFAQQLMQAWADWVKFPDVTWEHNWAACQRLLCRSWLRDGEVFAQLVRGNRPDLDHGTRVPFSIEMLEADFLDVTFNDPSTNIVQGIELNSWGRPKAYWLFKYHPGNPLWAITSRKRVPSENIVHLKLIDRVGQLRGVTALASILRRMNDVHEYEKSELVAARIAASLTGALKTEFPDTYTPPVDNAPRELNLQPGMILDNLRPGESLEIFSHNRPSPTLEPFRNGQLRAASSGIGLSYSSMARDYNGTYSAQRQELVEQFDAYRILSNRFIAQVVEPIWSNFVMLAIQSGIVKAPKGVDPLTIDDASYIPPAIPWIDPLKEASAFEKLLQNKLVSPQTIIRQRGGNPDEVLNQWQQWNEALDKRGLNTPSPMMQQEQDGQKNEDEPSKNDEKDAEPESQDKPTEEESDD